MPINNRFTFDVTLLAVQNAETGELFLLPSDRDIAEAAALARTAYEEDLERRVIGGALTESGKGKLLENFDAQQVGVIDRQKADRDRARPHAKAHDYTLVKPLKGEIAMIRAQATTYPDTGSGYAEPRWNEELYRTLLLKNDGVRQNGKTLTPQEIDGLDPAIADTLGAYMARALTPDPRRLPFSLPPSTRT